MRLPYDAVCAALTTQETMQTLTGTVMTAMENGNDPNEIGRRIALARKSRGWTQEDLGERSGHHKQSISEWERGNRTPQIDTLGKLADAFGITLEELVYGTKPKPISDLSEEAKDQIIAYLRLATQLLEEAPDRVKDRVSGPLEGISRIVDNK